MTRVRTVNVSDLEGHDLEVAQRSGLDLDQLHQTDLRLVFIEALVDAPDLISLDKFFARRIVTMCLVVDPKFDPLEIDAVGVAIKNPIDDYRAGVGDQIAMRRALEGATLS